MTIESLKALQTRIRECKGADLDLDWEIWCALCQPTEWWGQKIESVFRDGDTTPASVWGCKTADGSHHSGCGYIGRCTASLDACVALMAAVLPGWSWQVGAYPQVHAHVAEPVMTKYGPGIGVRAQTSGATVSLAFLDAIMSAVIAEEEQEKVNV